MDYKTEKKIKEIKEMIKNKIDFKEICKKKFNTENKRKDFLSKNEKEFTDKELKYLQYVAEVEIIEDIENTENIKKEEKALVTNNVNFYDILKASDKDKIKFLASDLVLEKIVQLLEEDTKHILTIPQEIYGFKDIENKTIRVSSELYERLTKLGKDNNVKNIHLTNFMIEEFLKKYE